MAALRAYSRTTCQTAFSARPSPHAFPFLFTLRNNLPTVTLAAWSQSSRRTLTHPGTLFAPPACVIPRKRERASPCEFLTHLLRRHRAPRAVREMRADHPKGARESGWRATLPRRNPVPPSRSDFWTAQASYAGFTAPMWCARVPIPRWRGTLHIRHYHAGRRRAPIRSLAGEQYGSPDLTSQTRTLRARCRWLSAACLRSCSSPGWRRAGRRWGTSRAACRWNHRVRSRPRRQ